MYVSIFACISTPFCTGKMTNYVPSRSFVISSSHCRMQVKYRTVQYLWYCDVNWIILYGSFILFLGIPECDFLVKDVLKFITGRNQIPPLGFFKKISVVFIHDCWQNCKCRPTTSTCDLQLRIPIHINSYNAMVESGLSMLSECQGFGNI